MIIISVEAVAFIFNIIFCYIIHDFKVRKLMQKYSFLSKQKTKLLTSNF